MPKRPVQHELEAYSRSRFGTLIPSNWIFRGLDQDYGVDGEIEIFENDGSSTGLKFLVQLKAVASLPRKIPSVSLREDTFFYFRSLTLPVLVVLYIKETDSFYARWAHSYDHYYKKRKNSKTITFRFEANQKWEKITPDVIRADAISYLELRSQRVSMPIRFSSLLIHDGIEIVFSKKIEASTIKNACKVPNLISIHSDTNLPNSIFISPNEIKIQLARMNGFTLHLDPLDFSKLTPDEISTTAITSIGMALFAHGHHIEAADIIESFLDSSIFVRDYSFCFLAARCLARANKYIQAAELAEKLSLNERSLMACHALLLPLWTEQNISQSEIHLCVSIANKIAKCFEDRGDLIQASVINYNLGNMLRKSRLEESFAYYNKALKLNSEYAGRSYFWREVAGICFLKCRYAAAVSFYKRSLDLEDDSTTRFLYADSLAFRGHYIDSLQEFRKSLLEDVDYNYAEWHLKKQSLEFLISFLSINRQKRVKSSFDGVPELSTLADAIVLKICMKTLELDALCAASWFNLGGIFYRGKDTELALRCFLLSALIQPNDLESWANAAGLALMNPNIVDATMILICAYWFNGGDFLEHLSERFPAKGSDFLLEISKAMSFISRTESSTLLRIHGPNRIWDSYDIPSSH